MPLNDALSDPVRERQIFVKRILMTGLIVLLLSAVVLYRYFDLQINRYQDFITHSDNNRIHVRPIPPSRGLIYDRSGKLLADNRSTYNLNIVVERSQDIDQLVNKIRSLIKITDQDIARFKKRLNRRKPFEPTPLKFDLTEQERALLAVNGHLLHGIEVTARLMRFYPEKELFAHVIGYVGRMNEKENRHVDTVKYSGTDFVGKVGLEKFYEDQLLGTVGNEHVETNAQGRVMRVLNRNVPIPGDDLVIHIDTRLQQVAFDALKGERGAVVAIEVKTGGILSMVSMPSYNPNLFISGISQSQYNHLSGSPDQPLFNRAIHGQYPPGSTIKPLFGLVGLQNGIVSMDDTIDDTGYFYMEGIDRPWRDYNSDLGGHGKGVTLAQAIVESCDVFFYALGVKMGIDLLSEYTIMFGLGKPTGIDLPAESSGIVPSRTWKQKFRRQNWFDGDTVNASIGQGFMLATPLQLALLTSRIASRGKLLQPSVVKSIGGVEVATVKMSEQIQIDDAYWDYIHRAMINTVHSSKGTARGISEGLSYNMAAKTGTVQVISLNQKNEYDTTKLDKTKWDHALFIAFAPADDPQIAVGVIVENGEYGSATAAPIARAIIDQYMNPALPKRIHSNKQLPN